MNIELIVVGKIKEKFLKQGIKEYTKRLQAYTKIKVIEVSDEPTKEQMSEVETKQILEKEAERIMPHLSSDRQVYVMAIEGKLVSSEELAKMLETDAIYGRSKVSFVIGGSLGLADEIKRRANQSISFGRITLPHQMMRLILTEQIYRAFRIINNHAYHK